MFPRTVDGVGCMCRLYIYCLEKNWFLKCKEDDYQITSQNAKPEIYSVAKFDDTIYISISLELKHGMQDTRDLMCYLTK